ncbi:hypothetical protein [Nocardia africana]
MTGFEPRPVASIHTIGTRMTPTHREPEETEDKSVDKDQVQAKVVTPPRRKAPRTTGSEAK